MLEPIKPIIFGHTLGRHPLRIFGINSTDLLCHLAIFGQTGTGKSTLLLSLLEQHASQLGGIALIDPHGDLSEALRNRLSKPVIYWNAAEEGNPFGYNPLTFVSAKYRPLVASALIETLKKQ